MEFKLLTDGKIEGYPKIVYGQVFKVKQWKDLSNASDNGRQEILTDCLDSVIDLERTGIKSTSELTQDDRVYLFLQQYIFCKSDTVNYVYPCQKEIDGVICNSRTPVVASLLKDLKEVKIKSKIKLKDEMQIEQVKIPVRVPTYKDIKRFQELMTEYSKILEIQNKDITSNKETQKKIANQIIDELVYLPYIDKEFETANEFINWYEEQDGRILKALDIWKDKVYHGFEGTKKVTCLKCGAVEEVEIPTDLSFFL